MMLKKPVVTAVDVLFRFTTVTKERMIGWNSLRQYHAPRTTATTTKLFLVGRTMGIIVQNWENNMSPQRRTFAALMDDKNENSGKERAITSSESYIGVVKLWLKGKGFGFLTARIGTLPEKDFFVNQASFVIPSSVVPSNENEPAVAISGGDSTLSPTLRKGERVRFRILTHSNGLQKAVHVTWVDGEPFTPLRKGYLSRVHARAKTVMGDEIYKMLRTNNVNQDPERLLQQIYNAYQEADEEISNAERKISEFGMKLEDFPLEKTEPLID